MALFRALSGGGSGGGTELSCTELQDNNYNSNVTTFTGLTIGKYYLFFGSAKSSGAVAPAVASGADAVYVKQNVGLVAGDWSRHNVIIAKATATSVTLTGEFYGSVLTEISIV